jgi:hypothetical protein
MKMLGFMIVLTVFYWFMATQAQTMIAATEPCAAKAAVASFDRIESHSASDILLEASGLDQQAVAGEIARLSVSAALSDEDACGG